METVNSHSHVIGIGASTGGLRALEEFFENMPPDSGASFVVIQHFSPDFKSMMDELLERRTSMDVHLTTDDLPLEPNAIYLIPPGKDSIVRDRRLYLADRERSQENKQPNFSIDIFFNSLARDCRSKAIAVILSGTGSDGSHGLTAIHQEGGATMVQDPSTSEFDGMPQSAIQTGIVDLILTPQDIARAIYDFVRSPLDILAADNNTETETSGECAVDAHLLQKIVKLLAENSRIDFSHYKPNTLCRRIQRRCVLAGFDNPEAYIQHLQQSDQERNILRGELLISVTRFFRDREAWHYLETEIIPQLFEQAQPNSQLRFWVTACATGEEAYSLGILLDEARQQFNASVQIKIFATDVDATALERASLGRYPLSIAKDISEERLHEYFTLRDRGYEVSRQLREMMIFSEHNLISDAVFPRMHLISCRNVLIYLQSSLQRRVLQNLHFALVAKGVLILGESETLSNLAAEFRPLQRQWKVFEKIRDVRLPNLADRIYSEQSSVLPYFFPNATGRQPQFDPLLEYAFKEFAIERQATCFLIDRGDRLLHIVADPLKLLQLPVGRVTYDIVQLLPEPLRLPLNTALHRARQVKETVEFAGIELGVAHENRCVRLQAKLYQPGAMARDFLLVTVQMQESVSSSRALIPEFQADNAIADRIIQLEYELQQTRANLQATIEELETTNEEQQASNEESIASNEELQSTNEELHSVNEELHTVNAEYQLKIEQLTELNADLDNLLQNTHVGVIFLDSDLKIRKFTETATCIVPLRASDIGRSLQDLKLNVNCPDLVDLICEVEAEKRSIQREIELQDEGTYLMLQIHPYRSGQDLVRGTVLTFVDIDKLKQAEVQVKNANEALERRVAERTAALQALNQRYELVFEGSQAGLVFWDIASDRAEISPQFAAIRGYPPSKRTTSYLEYEQEVHPEDLPRLQATIVAHLEEKAPYSIEYRVRHQQGHYIWVSETGQAVWDEDDRPILMSTSQQDISDRKQAEAVLKATQAEYELIFQGSGAGMWTWNVQTGEAKISARYRQILGFAANEDAIVSFEDFAKRVHPDDLAAVQQAIQKHFAREGDYKFEYRLQKQEGDYIWVRANGRAVWNEAGEPIFMAGSVQDISDRKEYELQLQELNQRYELIFKGSKAGLYFWDATRDRLTFSPQFCQIVGWEGKFPSVRSFAGFRTYIHPEDEARAMQAMTAHLEQGQPYEVEYRLRHAAEHYIWVLVTGQATWDETGQAVFMAGAIQDISDRKAREAELQQTIAQLEVATHSKDEFLAGMSHELRTPLNAILGLSESLQEGIFGAIDERKKQTLDTIYESGSHLLSLINDILDTAKIEAGKVELELACTNIRGFCQSSLRLIRQQAFQKEISLDLQLPERLPSLCLDERRIRQALLNFLSNAVKFTPTGGVVGLAVQVLPPVEPNGQASTRQVLRMSVTDTGIGISPQDRAKLFQPFSQLNAGLNCKHSGTGLGLFLTRQIVELHGGTVGVRSEVGKGSCFWIDLPFDEETKCTPENCVDDSVKVPPVGRDKPLVLLAEDNLSNVAMMRSYLEAKGLQLIFAENGQEAIEQARACQPDVILMDIQMPVMDGLEATRRIRQIPDLQEIPIVALTAFAMENDKEKCLVAGADDYLSKPIKLKQLARKIHQFILAEARA
ncbi:MAG: PAS domain-containing protein [Cyanobacteria bacterium P01_E01_bin.42]